MHEHVPADEGLASIVFDSRLVLSKLRKLKIKSSPGPDGLGTLLLSRLSSFIALPVSMMFERFFINGFVPEIWKLANVKPIFKSGDASLPGNYRPISLTCVLSKVMESIVRDQMLDYLLEKKLLSKQQHGFVAGRSTCTDLLESLQDWSIALNRRQGVDVLYIDFSKAFDSVVHSKLIEKLKAYGFRYELVAWISEFLKNRRQRVTVASRLSEIASVTSGVPQGSVIGTLLYLLFVNDIAELFVDPISCKLFADDVKLYSKISTQFDAIQLSNALQELVDWSSKW